MKSLLSKIVVQESSVRESLKEAQKLKEEGATPQAIAALTLALQSIREGLDATTQEAKSQFSGMPSSDSTLSQYTMVCWDYSGKIQKEALEIQEIAQELSQANPKIKVRGKLRDAPSSTLRKVVGHSAGPNTTDTSKQFFQETSDLKTSADQLSAATKWLFIIARPSKN
ncbi:MAG: hypothetical protein HY400_02240 [Elusimicrobia bacterium]|nr:hypothetical protein [Elusimicrobiota bacterium]